MQLWRMDADGGNLTQMTFDESNSWFAHFSPGGDRVVYIAYKKGDVEPDTHPPNRVVQLRLMSSNGGDFKVIAELFGGQGTINVNSWSPDNKTIAFVSYRLK
jgi:Tol biopolymer transport system component